MRDVAAEILANARTVPQDHQPGPADVVPVLAEIGARLTSPTTVATPVPGPGWVAEMVLEGALVETTYPLLGWNHDGRPVVLGPDGELFSPADEHAVVLELRVGDRVVSSVAVPPASGPTEDTVLSRAGLKPSNR